MATSRLYNIPDFIKGQFDYWVDHNAKRITVISADPDNLAGLDSQRIANYQNALNQAYARLMDAISSMKISWTIIGAASPKWAEKVFPDAKTPEEATDKLWAAIFKTTRIGSA